ncbi:MAG: putative hydrolase [bacterium]|nr:putative hydrolase [bacterium]
MRGAAALLAATAIWLPCLHWCFRPALAGERSQALAKRQLAQLDDAALGAAALAPARAANPEWDLMGQTFVAWALANDALRNPAEANAAVKRIDRMLASILAVERRRGFRAYLLPYAEGPYAVQPDRSLFVDSEVALTAALRRLVRDDDEAIRTLSRERIEVMAAAMRRAPLGLVESYPHEGWTFDHAVALAAIRVVDRLDGSDHRDVIARVLATMRTRLRDPQSGLVASSFTPAGAVLDGPEGSTLWMTLHCLAAVDEPFARAQYAIARRELGRSFLGFAWASEWPASRRGARDIDSGAVVPLLDVSAGSSGLAFVAAATFGDGDFLRELGTTLELGAFPIDDRHGRRYAASNQVGDAVLLYAAKLGPAWERVR